MWRFYISNLIAAVYNKNLDISYHIGNKNLRLLTNIDIDVNGIPYNFTFLCSTSRNHFFKYCISFVGPCHHGMARPQVADGGTASDMEGSCK